MDHMGGVGGHVAFYASLTVRCSVLASWELIAFLWTSIDTSLMHLVSL